MGGAGAGAYVAGTERRAGYARDRRRSSRHRLPLRRPRPDPRMESSLFATRRRLRGSSVLMDTVRRGNPYRVTRHGTLDLPGLAPIPVAGLTTVEATRRLTVEKLLQDFRIRLTRLPLEPPLKPFGHDIFADALQAFAPVTDIPVPVDYVVGPGDRLEIQLFGNTKGPVFADRQPRRQHQPSGAGPDPRQWSALRGCSRADPGTGRRADDRHPGQRLDDRSALDPGVRGRGCRATRIVHRQRSRDDHSRPVREWRREADRIAAQHPAEAQRQARDERWTCTTCCCTATRRMTSGCGRATWSSCRRWA